jgi:hypothetical protein
MNEIIEFAFEVDSGRLAEDGYCVDLVHKLRTALTDLRAELTQDDITRAKVADERERRRIAVLPKLDLRNPITTIQGSWEPNIGGKKIKAADVAKMWFMPQMTRAQAHLYLKDLVGFEWNTNHAFGHEADWYPFTWVCDEEGERIPGLVQGYQYRTDEEIANELEWELEREKLKAAAEAKPVQKEPATPEAPAAVEPEDYTDETEVKLEHFRMWLDVQEYASAELIAEVENFLREGLEAPIRGSLRERLSVAGADDAAANEICDMLEAYELHVWEIEEAEAQV